MATVRAEFDGKAFVPCEPVELPVGTQVEVLLPGPPRKPTEEDNRRWQEILREINSTDPYFPTLEDAMRYTRKWL